MWHWNWENKFSTKFDKKLSLNEINQISTRVFDKLLRAKIRLKLIDDFMFNMLCTEYNLDPDTDPEELINFIFDISVIPSLDSLNLDKMPHLIRGSW